MPSDHTEEKPASLTAEITEPRPLDRGLRLFHPLEDTADVALGLNEEELKRLPKETLLTIARTEDLPNRSKMNKAQLARTLRRHFRKAK